MEDFHRAPWSDRYALLCRFDDRRFEEFGERILYAEEPDSLPPHRLTALKAWHRERHTAEGESPWVTIGKALDELAEIRSQNIAEETPLIAEIESYLEQLKASHL